MSVFTTKATIASFGGKLLKLSHKSRSTGCEMAVNVYLPPAALGGPSPCKVPVLFWLSGLTCTPDNCTEKGFFQHGAARRGLAVVYPDTSPRGLGVAGEAESWDFGVGAGFYIDATQRPWVTNDDDDDDDGGVGWRMETYVAHELPTALFGDADLGRHLDGSRVSLAGHSMGGHGALTLYLKDPQRWASVSAFAPIANPCACPWGEKAFAGYLGAEHRDAWKRHDATELVRAWKGDKGADLKMLVDVGTADTFYKQGQLLPENLEKAVAEAGLKGLTLRYHEGYDHSYFFMASFSDEHVDHAAKHLGLL